MTRANSALMVIVSACLAMSSCKRNNDKLEVEEDRAFNFGEYDLDRNGFLNMDEIGRYMPEVTRDFETIDTDRDRQVSQDELRIYRGRMKGED